MDDNETINKRVHTEIMGECWHEWRVQSSQFSKCQNQDCNVMQAECPRNPDYCSDASPRSLLNEVVAKVRASGKKETDFVHELETVMPEVQTKLPYHAKMHLLSATAEQIARACVEAHKSEGDSNE